MGNAGSSGGGGSVPRDRTRTCEIAPPSPGRDGQVFTFNRNIDAKILNQGSQDEDEPYFTKPASYSSSNSQDTDSSRPRSNTISEVSDKTPTVFRWEGGGKDVQVSGTFSDWKTIPMVKSHGDFVTIIDLPEGEHQYKFFVDGEWKNDPSTNVIEKEGTKNNMIVVKKSDFEVFQALAKDGEAPTTDLQDEYSQIIPPNNPWQKTSGPPILPPHLLQVILNKDTPLSCEPTLLPEPNHVMLNHLYALSIKEGVMVLSATHRYRKKYVTTLLYKPI